MSDRPSAQFDHPPVRRTRLTVFFEPLDNFDIDLIAPLQERWSERYSGRSQTAPRVRPTGLPEVDPFGSGWPMPAIVQTSPSLSRKISYQFDQVTFSWTFDPEAAVSSYPGFEALSAELRKRFAEFVEIVEAKADSALVVQGCQCVYNNAVEEVALVDWVADHLDGWSGRTASTRFDEAEYVGFRVRQSDHDDTLGVDRAVSSQLDYVAGEGVSLEIDVVAVPGTNSLIPAKPQDAAAQLMEAAHELLIETFLGSISPSMKKSWGARS
jgi:uncharacterized protein (TIGR04255 family)